MIQQIRIAKWLLEIDVDRTRDFYKTDIDICGCSDCTNFVEACEQLDKSAANLFNNLGINPAMPANLSSFPTEEPMIKYYIGNYHLVGKVLKGESHKLSNPNETNINEIKNYNFEFSNELEFVPEDFPTPILQLNFEAIIPWILEEDPDD